MTGPRRPNGEGALYYRADRGRWIGEILIAPNKKRCVSHPDKARALELLRGILREAEEGAVTPGRYTVGQLFDRYLAHVKSRVEPGSYANYAKKMNGHLRPPLGHLQLRALTTEHIDRVFDDLLAAGYARSTVAFDRQVLGSALTAAVRWRLIPKSPARDSAPIEQKRTVRPRFSRADVDALLAAMKGHRFETLYLVLLGLGLRPSEAYGLTWDNVRLNEGEVRIVRRVVRLSKGREVRDGAKSEAGVRLLPLPQLIADALARHCAAQLEADTPNPQNLVFCTPEGRLQPERAPQLDWHKLLIAAGLTDRPLYSLRRACGTFLAALKVPPSVAQRILGHSTAQMTLRYYTDALDDDVKEAMTAMNTFLTDRFGGELPSKLPSAPPAEVPITPD